MSEVDRLLETTRAGLARLTPQQAHDAAKGGALLIDTRTAAQRARQGELPGTRVVVLCRQGYSSSLAAVSLRSLGVDATDVIGGVEAWAAAGLPLHTGPADVRE